jgi:guanylate kinase
MIVLLGDSCAGKSSIEEELVDRGFNRIISYTTRPKRDYEVDGIHYHFISTEKFSDMFKNNRLAEHTQYNGWYYGIAKEDCINDAIVVVEPNGFRQLKNNNNLNIISFYIAVDERERVIRMMERGDNVMESFRRIISDQGSFNGIENEVDHVVSNPRGLDNLIYAVDAIVYILKTHWEVEIE